MPVVIETEFAPASQVELDAKARLGNKIFGQEVEGVLAVRIPADLSERQTNLEHLIKDATFDYCLISGSEMEPARWPEYGWLSGGLENLADAIEYAALSNTRLTAATDTFEEGISNGAAYLRQYVDSRPNVFQNMEIVLHQTDCEQTTRMAVAIIANAFVFQGAVAGKHGISSPESLCDTDGLVSKLNVLNCWRGILEVNYWPIFGLAIDLLDTIPGVVAGRFLQMMIKLADKLAVLGTSRMHDLSGQMFQRLIADRKFLATFYTLPESAALLAGLAVCRLQVDWNDPTAVSSLQIADLACGTGTLVAAAQHSVAVKHRRTGGDDRLLHRKFMERVLVAADIMPAATHLTASMLSSAQPGSTFGDTRVFTMPYGVDNDEVQLGSLDLILKETAISLFGEDATSRSGGHGTTTQKEVVLDHESCDLVIMNPPFTRPTNHEIADVPIPSFAGFGTSSDEQGRMSDRLKGIRQQLKNQHRNWRELPYPAGDGNAGLASYFMDLAHAKLRPGGCLALVLPATLGQGDSWKQARRLLEDHYKDVTIISICNHGMTDTAFSADTGMAEILLVATRRELVRQNGKCLALVANLLRRPHSKLEGALIADALDSVCHEGFLGGTLTLGSTNEVGWYLRAPLSVACKAIGIRHENLTDTLEHLDAGQLKLPQLAKPATVPIVRLGELGSRGVLSRDVTGPPPKKEKPPRGPFASAPLSPDECPEFPMLWNHDAKRERRLVVAPDMKGTIRTNCEKRAHETWKRTASRLHFSVDFRINSQPLAACLTERISIGGRAWPNFLPKKVQWEIPLVLWANSTLGLISFWWEGTRQQQGRCSLSIARHPNLMTLDVSNISRSQIIQCNGIFENFRNRCFLPANEAYRDQARLDLDKAMLIDLLRLDDEVLQSLDILRLQWCLEPTVHGGKSTRPKVN
ncbi:MAG: hypothetical protein OXB95_07090 [Rhodobacteraceae bacterium]|nr:hypothetical protein [Paracoccaceae bacterium]